MLLYLPSSVLPKTLGKIGKEQPLHTFLKVSEPLCTLIFSSTWVRLEVSIDLLLTFRIHEDQVKTRSLGCLVNHNVELLASFGR